MDALDALQWPAMAITIVAAWLVAGNAERGRRIGFWLYLVSNVLWIAWGVHSQSWALVLLQFALGAMNIRGERKTAEKAA